MFYRLQMNTTLLYFFFISSYSCIYRSLVTGIHCEKNYLKLTSTWIYDEHRFVQNREEKLLLLQNVFRQFSFVCVCVYFSSCKILAALFISHFVVRFQSFWTEKHKLTRLGTNKYSIQKQNQQDETKCLAFGSHLCGNSLILTSDSSNLSSQDIEKKTIFFQNIIWKVETKRLRTDSFQWFCFCLFSNSSFNAVLVLYATNNTHSRTYST